MIETIKIVFCFPDRKRSGHRLLNNRWSLLRTPFIVSPILQNSLKHAKMPQCIHNGRFLFRRALRRFGIFLLRQMIVLASLQPALRLTWEICRDDTFKPVCSSTYALISSLVIDDFALRRSQIQLISIQLHLDMLLSIEFGQQAHRLHMAREDRKYVISRTVRPT